MATTKILRVIICSGTMQLEKKKDFYKVITPYIAELSSCGALPRCNPTTLNSRNLRRLIVSFEEDVAPDLDLKLVQKCRVRLAVLEKLYNAVEILELQGFRVAAKFLSELVDGSHEATKKDVRLELISNEALTKLHMDLNREGGVTLNDGPAAFLDSSIIQGKLNKLADILENHFLNSTLPTRILIAVPSLALAKEVNKILLAMPRIASSFLYDVQRYSRDVHKRFIVSQENCIVVISDPLTNKASAIEISGIDLVICYDVPKTAFRKVSKWKGSIYVLLTDVENRSFDERTLLVDERSNTISKTGSHSMTLKGGLVKQAARGRKGYLTKDEQVRFDRNFLCGINVILPGRAQAISRATSQLLSVYHLSLSDWGPWQKECQQTFGIGHSEDTEAMVETVALCDSLDGRLDINYFEKYLYAHFCLEDVLSAQKGRGHGTKSDNDEYMDVDNEEFIYKAYDFFAITREMRRYVLNSAEKINDFLCEVGITISPQRSEIDTDGVGTQVSGTATSTSPISLAGTDGPLQNTENPLISSKQSCTTLIIQAIPDTATEASAGLGVANTEEATRRDLCLESAELFNAVVTPIARKRLPATSTPFEGAALMHRIPDNLTPLRPHQVRVNRGNRVALREVETMDSTGGRSRLGVTALVNIVQKRKKQKKLQHFFKAQMKPEKRLSNICESILILSQDDNKNDTSSNVERAYIPEAGALIPENNFQQNSHLISNNELVFDPDEHRQPTSNQKESIHSTAVSHNYSQNNINDRELSHDGHVEIDQVNPVESDSSGEGNTYIFNEINKDELVFDPHEHHHLTSNQKESIHSTIVSHDYSPNNINDRKLSHDGHVEIDQVNPVESDSCGEDTYIFNEINEDEIAKRVDPEMEEPLGPFSLCESIDGAESLGSNFFYKASKKVETSKAIVRDLTEVDKQIFDKNFVSAVQKKSASGSPMNKSPTAININDDTFERIDKQANVCSSRNRQIQKQMFRKDVLTETRTNNIPGCSKQKAFVVKQFRSVFDALNEHEKAVKPQESVKSMFDIINKMTTRDEEAELKVNFVEKPAEVGNIFTKEFEEELRTTDEQQRTQEMKRFENIEEDSEDIFNEIVESCLAKNKADAPVQQNVVTDWKSSQKKAFAKQKTETIQESSYEISPCKLLPITIASRELKNTTLGKKESVGSCSDDKSPLLLEDRLKPKKLSLVEKLRLGCRKSLVLQKQEALLAEHGGAGFHITQESSENKSAESGDFQAKTSSSENEMSNIERRNFREQKTYDRNWSCLSDSVDSKNGNTYKQFNANRPDKEALRQVTEPTVHLKDGTMSDIFEGFCKHRRKKPRCEFLEEEAELDLLNYEAVSTDEDENETDTYENNSFVDDTSLTAQSQGMYLELNARLSPREGRLSPCSTRNPLPIKECYSETPTDDDDMSYDSQDSFIVKGDVPDVTLPLEITVMRRASTLSTAKTHRGDVRKCDKARRNKCTKRRRVFLLSASDKNEASTSASSEYSPDKDSSTTVSKIDMTT